MLAKPFQRALPVLKKLESNGFRAFFVGGSVRDALIGRQIGDIDITTSAEPWEVMRLFEKVIPVGIEHGTVIVRWHGESFEVTTFRVETSYSDNRHPDQVSFVKNVTDDLARRDFTINAIAMDYTGEIIDPFEGKKDLEEKVIKAVGNPEVRFREDALRMMRAVRFVSQLGFKLDKETNQAIRRNGHLLEKNAVERITVEIEKLFAGEHVNSSLELILSTRLVDFVPVWKKHPQLMEQWKQQAAPLYSMEEILVFFILTGTDTELATWVREWKLSNRVKNNSLSLLYAFNYFKKKGLTSWLVYKLPVELWEPFNRLAAIFYGDAVSIVELEQLADSLPIRSRSELDIDGRDIISMYPDKPKGNWIKEIIEKVEQLVVCRKLANDKIEIKEWVRSGEHPQTTD